MVRTENRDWLVPKALEPFGYDADGNLTTNGLWEFKWDAENRHVRMTSTLPTSNGFTRLRLDFKYDFVGRRIEKRVLNLDTSVETTARRFVYDGWNLIAELDGAGSAIIRSYTWGLDLADSLGDTGGVGALLRITNYSSGSPSGSYFPAYDANGNIIALLSASTGDPAAVYEYDPFGNPMRQEVIDSAVTDQAFRFSTKYADAETGLVYYGYRYYDPRNGRFLGRDPLGESAGLNHYGYSGNDAINDIDVLGLEIFEREGPPDANGCYIVERVEITDAGEKVLSTELRCPSAAGEELVALPEFEVRGVRPRSPQIVFDLNYDAPRLDISMGGSGGVLFFRTAGDRDAYERQRKCDDLRRQLASAHAAHGKYERLFGSRGALSAFSEARTVDAVLGILNGLGDFGLYGAVQFGDSVNRHYDDMIEAISGGPIARSGSLRNSSRVKTISAVLSVFDVALDIKGISEGYGDDDWRQVTSSSSSLVLTGISAVTPLAPAIGGAKLGINAGVLRYQGSWAENLRNGFAEAVVQSAAARDTAQREISRIGEQMNREGCR